MEYYSALMRNGILTHATTLINLKDIMLSDRRYSQKGGMRYDSTCTIVNHIATEHRMGLPGTR